VKLGKITHLILLFSGFIGIACSSTSTSDLGKIEKEQFALHTPDSFVLNISKGRDLTEKTGALACNSFDDRRTGTIRGNICEFSTQEALKALGIFPREAFPLYVQDDFPSQSKWIVVSGVATNPLLPSATNKILEGERDCDVDGGPLFRPTATCRVFLRVMESGRFLFAEFVTFDRRKQRTLISKRELQTLLQDMSR